LVNGFRYGLLGVSDIDIRVGLGMLVAFTLGLFWLNLVLMRRGVGLKT
jgi:ABC-2 type transport system permease protein